MSHGGTDPKYIADFEVFEGLSHQDIYDAVQKMQPGVMQQFGDKWVEMFTEISGAVTGLMIQTARATSSLDGAFAAAGEAAGRRFITEVTDVYTVLSVVGHRVKAAAYGAEAVKIAVPEPVSSSDSPVDVGTSMPVNVTELVLPDTGAAVAREKEDRRLQAIAAMNSTYKPTYGPAGESVPAFVAPSQPGDGTGDPGSGGGGSNNGGASGGGTGPGDAGDTATTEDPNQPGATTDDETSSAGTDDDDSSGTDDSQGQNSTTNPASTDPSSTTPSATTPGAGSPGTGSPGGSSPGGGSPGGGSPGGSTPGSGTPTPGGALAGRGPVVAGQNPGAGGPSGSAGSSGRGMSPGMMGAPGARGGGKDDEDEHKAPDYLRGVQPELLGDEQHVVPQAIGADAPATRLPEQESGNA
ncbi:hypothetical protein AB0I35_03900 [Nocardia sp. NPDC050378]|uniref:hypothetical protein n=1 Tax=Nocardia sp. NPDC050378 TaxID=3155400 RepID=UPI0033C509C8